MAKEQDNKSASGPEKTVEYFNVGAPLHAVRPSYIHRKADQELFDTVVAGQYAYVIAPARTGKTSLIASTSARLQNNGYKIAVLDLAQISERDGASDAGRWYYSIAYRLSRQLRLKTDLHLWWQDHSILSNRQRLVEFYAQVILRNVEENVVVFVDGIEHVSNIPFTEHLLASIRAAHNSRITEPEFGRLCFVTMGECDPFGLVDDIQLSPFSVSTQIHLNDFARQDLDTYSAELNLQPANAIQALDRVFYWTNGQPYLCQKLCRSISRNEINGDVNKFVDRLALDQLAGRSAIANEPHLSHLQRVVLSDKQNAEALLTLYGKIRKGAKVETDTDLVHHRQLLATGLVVAGNEGYLVPRNRIYAAGFTARWANENLPLRWRGPAMVAAIILVLTAIPFAYTQLLPKPYLRVMANSTYELETVADAYQSLRSFPGHQSAADRMYRSVLEARAGQVQDRRGIRQVARYATQLPAGDDLANQLSADFWDRQVNRAMYEERRDDAVLASIESLELPTQSRRRRAAALIGDDYAQLLATIPAEPSDDVFFSSDHSLLTRNIGANIRQWSASGADIEARPEWTVYALEVSPLVRRVIVDRDGIANRVGLTVNVSHARLDDIRMKLIAPSGRATELSFDASSSAANEEIRVPQEQLVPLLGESLNGTWSLSLRDEATGVSGHLVGWKLNLNAQVVVESFERGLDISDPQERAAENLWFTPDGNYAIARALQSDSARLWDLNLARAARTIAVPANEEFVGLSANAQYLVTAAQNNVNLWRTLDGRRHVTLNVGVSFGDILMSDDGEHLLAKSQNDVDTLFEVWSMSTASVAAELTIAGVPALHTIDSTATYLAVADFDRAVRVWNLRTGNLSTQIDLNDQPSQIQLSANGDALGILLGDNGVSLWSTKQSDSPLVEETGLGDWRMAFSPSGTRFIAGNRSDGMQIFQSIDGAPSSPVLDSGFDFLRDKVFDFSHDEVTLVSVGLNDNARFWSMPVYSTSAARTVVNDRDLEQPRSDGEENTTITAIAPGGEWVAEGDRSGHVHVHRVDQSMGNVVANTNEISFLGHNDAVLALEFSANGELVASAGADGQIRIWDVDTGLPRPFYGKTDTVHIDELEFSPSANRLAVLSGQRVWLMNAENGTELADLELGERHADIAFAADDQIYLAADSGRLRSLYSDRTGNWHLRTAWQSPRSIRNLEIAPTQQTMVLVDNQNVAYILNPLRGEVGESVLALPDNVRDISFSPNESRVLFRTGRWIHRALVSPAGLSWTDTIRSPKAVNGSRFVFETSETASGRAGDRVLVLTNATGKTELAELFFDYADGPALFGPKSGLLRKWEEKLRPAGPSDFVREGF